MKKLLFILFASIGSFSFGQSTNVYGDWLLDPGCACKGPVFITGSDQAVGYFSLQKSPEVSVGGLYIDTELGLAGPFSFVADVDAERIRGTVKESIVATEKPLSVDVYYKYDPKKDVLIVSQTDTKGVLVEYAYYRARD